MRNTKKGFTLVELLVVIAILAILATVSVVGYTQYINNANNSKAQQELTQLRDYAMAYDLTHDGDGAKDGKVNTTEADKAIADCAIEGVARVGNNVTYTVGGKVIAYWDITEGTITLGAPAAGGEGSGEGEGNEGNEGNEGGEGEGTQTTTYVKVTSVDDFTTGQYVLVAGNGYSPTVYDGDSDWVLVDNTIVSENQVGDATNALWTLTVSDSSVVITDKNGISIAPKGGNTNGITTGTYSWNYTFNEGTITFTGNGSDTVTLASNDTANNGYGRIRAYKNTTVTGSAYSASFTIYKLVTE